MRWPKRWTAVSETVQATEQAYIPFNRYDDSASESKRRREKQRADGRKKLGRRISPMPRALSNPPVPLLFLFFLLIFPLCFYVVRSESESSALRLPSDDPCARFSVPASCPVNCFRPDPVCGADGVTYWCGCADAMCAGARVAKVGFCEVGNGGNGLVSGQALLLVHIVWLIVLGFSVLFGLF
ncbi:hypothetical protein ACLOJK_032154 [Asimina triloba]